MVSVISTVSASNTRANLASTHNDFRRTVRRLSGGWRSSRATLTEREIGYGAAERRIRDANVAEESTNLTRYSIVTQFGIAILAQAREQSPTALANSRLP